MQIILQWKGGLAKPQLDGTRAEYTNAVPGADVVVEATRTGFEQFVEIKQQPAEGGYTYTLPLKAKGLKAKQLADGSVQFTDKNNKKQAVMPAPVMWDATVEERSGEHTHHAKVGLKVVQKGSSVDLVVTPDAGFVTVDPSTSSLSNVFDPSPLLVVPAVLWTVVAAAAVIASVTLSGRARRREPESAVWNPFGPDLPYVALAAVAGYAVAAVVRGEFSLSAAAFGILWPAMAATALAYAAGRRGRTLPRWVGPAFAAVGAVLYGALAI